jgi:phage gp36-like protein
MAYCTLNDITQAVPVTTVINLTDDAGSGAVDQGKVDTAIADAAAEIDSYCATRYTVPFAVVPAIIRKTAADIAVYNLYSRCAEKVPETREARYKASVKLLENISKGIVTLGEVPAPPALPQNAATPEITSAERLFTRTTMKGL